MPGENTSLGSAGRLQFFSSFKSVPMPGENTSLGSVGANVLRCVS